MQRQSIRSQTHSGIMKDILGGTYKTDDIINEKILVKKYGVSKTPVGEMLVQLCSEGILNSIPRFGYRLTVILPSQVIEIVEYRKIIELGALEMSFPHLTRGNPDQLKALNEDAGKTTYTKDSRIHWEANMQFHKTLCGFCNNTFIQRSLSDTLDICTRISNQYFIQAWNNSQASDERNHIRLVEAMEERNLEQTKEIPANDVEASKDEIL